jgi:site-specific DNA recombinase
MQRRAAIYARISQDREGAGLGVERQEQDCRDLADRLGWTVTAVFTDNDVSAYTGKRRKGFEAYIDLCRPLDVPTHTVWAGVYDLTTPTGRAVARTVGAWARFEGEHKSERTKRQQRQAAEDGKWLGGPYPFGWNVHDDVTAELDPVGAPAIQAACQVLLGGGTLTAICRDWNTRGIRTTRGGTWTTTAIRQVLRRSRNAGIVTLNGAEIAASKWPAIVDADTYRAVRAILDNPARRTASTNRAKYLLSGIALCGREDCGHPMISSSVRVQKSSPRSPGNMTYLYRCSNRTSEAGPIHASRKIAETDEYVTLAVQGWLNRREAREALQPRAAADSSELHSRAETLRHRRDEAGQLFATGQISGAQLAAISVDVQRQLDEIDARLAGGAADAAIAGLFTAGTSAPGDRWAGWDLDRRRAVLRQIVTVTILPGDRHRSRRFDPALIGLGWLTPED